MHSLFAVAALIPVAFSQNILAGGSQAPPPAYATAPITAVPTVATIITLNGTSTSVSPIPTPATTPLTYPLLNTSSIATSSSNNLSTSRSTTGKPTSSFVLITTSLPGGGQSTITSFVDGGAGGPTPTNPASGSSPSGATQPGAAGRLGGDGGKAMAALVAFGGAIAILL